MEKSLSTKTESFSTNLYMTRAFTTHTFIHKNQKQENQSKYCFGSFD
jgi:hypothetical protein